MEIIIALFLGGWITVSVIISFFYIKREYTIITGEDNK